MAILSRSPTANNYERLEGGMGVLGPNMKWKWKWSWTWRKFAIGVVLLVCLVWFTGPRATTITTGYGPGEQWGLPVKGGDYHPPGMDVDTLPLPAPPAPAPAPTKPKGGEEGTAADAAVGHPTSFATDPDPLKTTHCTTPFRPSSRLVQYALMIDAGSTGSRIHIYKFHNCDRAPSYEYEVFKQVVGGLSSYAGRADEAARSLDVLLDEAVRVVPRELRKCTPVALKATAGLRMLPGRQSRDILDAVKERLGSVYEFPLAEKDPVTVMEGKDEAVYAWITANYLLDTIRHRDGGGGDDDEDGKDGKTFAVLDLGGASTQIVFEPKFAKPDSALVKGDHKYELDFGGSVHVLYQHSYLGYGLMRARKHVHQLVEFMDSIRASDKGSEGGSDGGVREKVVGNPCLAKGTSRVVEINDDRTGGLKNVTMVGEEVGSFEGCKRVIELVMAKDAICEIKPCSFNGVYQPSLLDTFPASSGKVLLLSYFYDRISPLFPIPPGQSTTSSTSSSTSQPPPPPLLTISTIPTLARAVCAGRESWLTQWGTMPAVMEELAGRPEWCLDLTFMYGLLRLGYEFEDGREVGVGKQVQGTELGWCLGATLAMVGGELKCKV